MELRSDIKVQLMEHCGGDENIIAAARVSTQGPRSAEVLETGVGEADGLINFLMRNRHGTPFEHASMTFLVEAPIFVFREWHRHRIGWSYNEASGRYSVLPPQFYLPGHERKLKQIGKPGHYTYVAGEPILLDAVWSTLRLTYETAYAGYQVMLENGVAKEVARMGLPVAIYSSMYATCNPRSLMAFLSLRTEHEEATFPSHPMAEIAMGAQQMEEIFAELFPIVYSAYIENGRVAP